MATEPRIDVEGGIHHVMNRGASGRDVFLSDADRHRFLHLLATTMQRAEIEILAYCLMDNHYHLILRCPSGGLSRAMQTFASQYVRTFNKRNGFDGPLFHRRFTSVLITTDTQLQNAVRYVHRNPLTLGAAIDTYGWSSYRAYIGQSNTPEWLSPELALELLGGPSSCKTQTETDVVSDKTNTASGLRVVHATEAPAVEPAIDAIISAVAACARASPMK